MKLLTLKITPISNFATYPKGDTIFGQIVSYLYLKNDNTFDDYLLNEPKLIVSDMMPFGYVYRPTLPLDCFETEDKKELRKRKFISINDLQDGNLNLDTCESIEFLKNEVVIKNSINRITFSTDEGDFAPYGNVEINFFRNLWMFVLVDDDIKDKILQVIEDIGKLGFGKDVSIGKGNFKIEEIKTPIREINSNYYMSVSPTILKGYKKAYYDTFVRFGKFGLDKAFDTAFKKPVLMADSGAIVKIDKKVRYFGNALNNGYKEKPSFLQGYSIAIPFKFKDEKCLSVK
ncbi:CRISPR-associated protein, Csm4 family [Caminibacter profundus]